VAETNAWRDANPGRGPEQPVGAERRSPWWIRPEGRTRWLLLRKEEQIAELGMLGTGEWWICPVSEALPWAETYGSRGAAIRAIVTWWLHTHPFERE
jgi:hypothetical protein